MLTEENRPSGGMAWPPLKPQQAAVPSSLTPQVCSPPALTDENRPSGGVDRPNSFQPQQATGFRLLSVYGPSARRHTIL